MKHSSHLGWSCRLRWNDPSRENERTCGTGLFICLLFAGLQFGALLVGFANTAGGQDRHWVSHDRLALGHESQRSASVRAADVDGDGDLDLLIANGRHWPGQNQIFVNQGRARFNVVRSLGTEMSTSYACEPADFDGDGDLDVAIGNDNAPCRILLNDGAGRFREGSVFGSPTSVRSMEVADLDNDGDVDLLVTCRGRANIIHWNDGTAQFADQTAFGQTAFGQTAFGSKSSSSIDVAAADLNEDGYLDLIVANRDDQANVLLVNNGDRSFQDPISFGSTIRSSRAVATGDFNRDGHVDWVIGNLGAANELFLGDGKGGYTQERAFGRVDGRSYSIAVADMNLDGRLDIIVGNVGQPNAVFVQTEGAFDPTEEPSPSNKRSLRSVFSETRFGDAVASTYGLCVGDFNGDGNPDIAVANSGSLNRVFLNQSKRK